MSCSCLDPSCCHHAALCQASNQIANLNQVTALKGSWDFVLLRMGIAEGQHKAACHLSYHSSGL